MASKTISKKRTQSARKAVSLRSKKTATVQNVFSSSSEREQFLKTHKKQLTIGAIVIVLLALLYFFKGLFVVALVNGAPISRIDLIKQLEKQDGKKILSDMITKELIEQEARRKKVNVSTTELDTEVKKIDANLAAQGQKLDTLLAMQGFTKKDLLDRIRTQKLIEKMVSTSVSLSDAEITDYIDKNKTSFPEGTSEDKIMKQAKDALLQQKLDEKVQAFVADLQKKAKITYFVNY